MSATLLANLSRTTDPRTMLRRFLALDAVVTTTNGLVYAAGSGPVGRLLGVGSGLLLGLGLFLVAFGAGVGYLATRPEPAALPVKAVIEANLAWAVAGLAALVFWFSPTTAGTFWIPVQAATVAGFAGLQHLALRARG
ncbi:hypothetical protein AR457_06605 [Streptomyces agglomeratus]|uniref:hypothetical protein n=1 Tax=Streptomyces agglomeratus TaxID=285458 RepID=UPI00085431C7|nr:hypothetical protein [Streptomyces agglomeratus]OEJ41803.1 hypothetical protein BGK70_30040 [Streptomyces agglomeratus]OEJ43819.1 hypothetical protein AR457_06605 [Streptomyces agglomeratus]